MTLSINKISLCGLLFALAMVTSLHGAEIQTPPTSTENATNGHAAKIISIDKAKGIVTLEIKGKIQPFFLNPHVIDTHTHNPVTPDQLISGQFISFVTRPNPGGQLEIVSLVILRHGSGNAGAGGKVDGGPAQVSPFK